MRFVCNVGPTAHKKPKPGMIYKPYPGLEEEVNHPAYDFDAAVKNNLWSMYEA